MQQRYQYPNHFKCVKATNQNCTPNAPNKQNYMDYDMYTWRAKLYTNNITHNVYNQCATCTCSTAHARPEMRAYMHTYIQMRVHTHTYCKSFLLYQIKVDPNIVFGLIVHPKATYV